MNRHFVLASLASCMLVPSCRVLEQRVDLSWFGDTLSAPQSDSVYVESGRGLPTAESPASPATTSAEPTHTPSSSAAAAMPATASLSASSPAAGAHASVLTHTVDKGDTLSSIARRYHSSVAAICAANGITNPDTLKLGSVLTIPSSPGYGESKAAPSSRVAAEAPQKRQTSSTAASKRGFWQFWKRDSTPPPTMTYTVRQGDTLNAIARRHGVTPAVMMNANGMTKAQANKLRVGQNLILPTPKK